MKWFTKNLVIVCAVLSYGAFANKPLEIIDITGQTPLSFDYKLHYLNVNISKLDPIVPNAPSLWERLVSKKTSYGMVYIEVESNNLINKIPLLTYELKSENKYDIKSIPVSDSLTFPILNKITFDPKAPPKVRLVTRYWVDSDKLTLVRDVIQAANILGNVTTSDMEDSIQKSTLFVSLIERMWPLDDETKSVDLFLTEENLKNEQVSFGYDNNEVVTFKFSVSQSHFYKKPFSSALSDYKPEQLDVYRDNIIQQNDKLEDVGLEELYKSIKSYSKYVESLPINYADKVLLLAHSIQEWATDAVEGNLRNDKGEKLHLSYAKYRRLDNSDRELLDNLTDNVLTDLYGWNRCSKRECINMADFLSKVSNNIEADKYLPPTINLIIDGTPSKISKEDFKKSIEIYNDPGWSNFSNISGRTDKWSAKFNQNTLYFKYKDKNYYDAKINFTLSKIKANIGSTFNYWITSIEIEQPDSSITASVSITD